MYKNIYVYIYIYIYMYIYVIYIVLTAILLCHFRLRILCLLWRDSGISISSSSLNTSNTNECHQLSAVSL